MKGPTRFAIELGGALVFAALLAERARAFLGGERTDFDDAYMFVRYADHILGGDGIAWNPGGPPTWGVTGQLHLVLVALVRAAAPAWHPGSVVRFASAAAGLGVLVALPLLAAATLRRAAGFGWRWPTAATFLALCGFSDAFWFHARTGMDTLSATLAGVAVTWTALRLGREPSPRRALAAAGAGLLALLARPDGAIYAAATPLLALALLAPPGRTRRRAALLFVAGFAALATTAWLVAWRTFDSVAPLPFFAKRPFAYAGFVGEYGWNPFLFLRVFLGATLPFVIALVVGVGRASWRPVAVLLAPVVATFAVLGGFNQVMGHLGRFYLPALPFVVLAAAEVAGAWWTGPVPGRTFAIRLAVAAAVIGGGDFALRSAARRYEGRAAQVPLASVEMPPPASRPTPLPDLDSWRAAEEVGALLAAAPPGTRAAMSEHGLPGALAPRVVIDDVLGLHDPVFARGFSAEELFRRAPDLLWLPHPDHTGMLRAILDHPALRAGWDFYPDAFVYGVALRRDSPRFAALDRLLHVRWLETYGRPLGPGDLAAGPP